MPAWPGRHKAALTDGTPVTYRLVGDEYGHHFVSSDGYLLRPMADGCFQRQGLYAEQQQQLMAQARRAQASSPRHLRFFSRKMNEEGFSYNGATGSCRDYYVDQSDGLFQPTFDVVGPIKLKHNMAYYGSNGGVNSSDIRPHEMVVEASTYAHDSLGVDFNLYDNNHDGTVDFVYVYYAGYAESYGAATYTIWPHASNLTQLGIYASFDGVMLDRYACSSELRYTTGTEAEGIGTFCHEFGHVLGLPDMYDTMYSAETLGSWDLMCSGSYNNDSRTRLPSRPTSAAPLAGCRCKPSTPLPTRSCSTNCRPVKKPSASTAEAPTKTSISFLRTDAKRGGTPISLVRACSSGASTTTPPPGRTTP